jgi:nucleolar protein 56
MNERIDAKEGWFDGLNPENIIGASEAITEGTTDTPHDWPSLAVGSGFADDSDEYYELLHEATMTATRAAVREREQADDQQIIHSVRSMDDADRVANELAERVSEWAGSRFENTGAGIEYVREIATHEPTNPVDSQLVSLASRVRDLADESEALREHIERTVPEVAPNLSMLAGPVLAARLIALAGGLDSLAKSPSGTVQVLGAEDALFAHLRGRGSSPKHGVIYVHEYVSGTTPEHRGSASRALAGKLTIAARVDHYSGERKPELQTELDDRIARIRDRGDD